jgi:hypothetical protein
MFFILILQAKVQHADLDNLEEIDISVDRYKPLTLYLGDGSRERHCLVFTCVLAI